MKKGHLIVKNGLQFHELPNLFRLWCEIIRDTGVFYKAVQSDLLQEALIDGGFIQVVSFWAEPERFCNYIALKEFTAEEALKQIEVYVSKKNFVYKFFVRNNLESARDEFKFKKKTDYERHNYENALKKQFKISQYANFNWDLAAS